MENKKRIMAIFERQHFGKPITKELANYISVLKVEGDIQNISEKHSYAPHSLTAIVRRRRNINEKNAPMVIDLIKKCMDNYSNIQNKRQEFQKTI
jgi:hypothetical protein|tara:strand:+ start:51 stop:335 length:285 start_codon:yes stop_codon:yes gene_type:complete